MPSDQVKEKADAFGFVGEAFYACANNSLLDQRRERLVYYANAAECFVQGNRLKEAADCFKRVGQYGKAARAYREGGYFDEMAEVLERHGDQIEAGLLTQLTKAMAMFFERTGRNQVYA